MILRLLRAVSRALRVVAASRRGSACFLISCRFLQENQQLSRQYRTARTSGINNHANLASYLAAQVAALLLLISGVCFQRSETTHGRFLRAMRERSWERTQSGHWRKGYDMHTYRCACSSQLSSRFWEHRICGVASSSALYSAVYPASSTGLPDP